MYTENDLLRALKKSWSIHSSSKWSIDNPAKGQCGVTTLVVNDIIGGKIYKTWLGEGWHFYNILDGERKDFTQEQFSYNLEYQDVRSNREEAFQDTNDIQYSYLKSQVYENLRGS
ncbi:YunG family protein [Lysinibacillus xylanilyticus]|uniref:YunG family protein n=1 Tax=Lysinibacillus xylanilyticus TaxID=582475 RepID=UPI003D05F511